MEWIKRNLVLVISGVVVLVLIAAAGYYLFRKMQEEKAKTALISEYTQKLQALYAQDPYPNATNTEVAAVAQEQLQALLKEVGRFYPLAGSGDTNPVTNAKIKFKLIEMTAHLRDQAQRTSIVLPTNFNFSFTRQIQLMQLATNSLETLEGQLLDVQALCEVLFKSQIPELLMLRRAPVGKDDQDAVATVAQDYLANRPPQTNDWSVRYPYEITFKGLTPELKQILEGLAHSPRGFVVRYVKVEPFNTATQMAPDGSMGGAAADYYTSRYGIQPRYGMRGRYGPAPPVEPVAPPPPKPTTGAIVEKQPLKITLMVEAVRSLPAGAKVVQAAPASPDGPGATGVPDPAADPNATPAQPQAAN